MDYKMVFTGSCETERELRVFLSAANEIDDGVPKSIFTDDYMFKVMTVGRNGVNDPYPGSQAIDDTGGFFKEQDGMVYLTDKAKDCISV